MEAAVGLNRKFTTAPATSVRTKQRTRTRRTLVHKYYSDIEPLNLHITRRKQHRSLISEKTRRFSSREHIIISGNHLSSHFHNDYC